eukprot:Lankesteria_metandrocarpae@DN8150_c0_g1_i1.p1
MSVPLFNDEHRLRDLMCSSSRHGCDSSTYRSSPRNNNRAGYQAMSHEDVNGSVHNSTGNVHSTNNAESPAEGTSSGSSPVAPYTRHAPDQYAHEQYLHPTRSLGSIGETIEEDGAGGGVVDRAVTRDKSQSRLGSNAPPQDSIVESAGVLTWEPTATLVTVEFVNDSPGMDLLEGMDHVLQWNWKVPTRDMRPNVVYLHLIDHRTGEYISALHFGLPVPNTGSFSWSVDTCVPMYADSTTHIGCDDPPFRVCYIALTLSPYK